MSGICGFTGKQQYAENIINAMSTRFAHRGPNNHEAYLSESVALGARRLDHDSQNMFFNEDKSRVIIYNGKIYNSAELREELEAKGRVCANNCDAEVILALYEEDGSGMLSRLRGMFAFVIYDIGQGTVFAARDHFGVKPLYYSQIGGEFVFASEIKCFLEYPEFEKELNTTALENYLTFQYSVLDETFFRGVYKLPPAHFLTFSGGELTIERYFEADFEPQNDMTLEQAVEQISLAVKESLARHTDTDFEVGSLLSSGVDSSYVAATFGGKNTFSVGFEFDNYNETIIARELAEQIGVNNHRKIITPDEFWETFPKIQYMMDEPLADPAAAALFFASQLASEHVSCVLSGEGADEFFAGYNIYQEPLALAKISWLPLTVRKALATLVRAIPFSFKGKNYIIRASKPVEERFIGNANIFSKDEREKILKAPTGNYPPAQLTKPVYDKAARHNDITKMQLIDINFWAVGDILLKADRMSMANSIELRSPLLDTEVFKVAARIPKSLLVTKATTKCAFRLAAKQHLPEAWSKRRKLGFPVPTRFWLRETQYYNIVKSCFTSKAAEQFFVTSELVRLLDDHKAEKADNGRKIWVVYTFLIWYNEYFGEAIPTGDLT